MIVWLDSNVLIVKQHTSQAKSRNYLNTSLTSSNPGATVPSISGTGYDGLKKAGTINPTTTAVTAISKAWRNTDMAKWFLNRSQVVLILSELIVVLVTARFCAYSVAAVPLTMHYNSWHGVMWTLVFCLISLICVIIILYPKNTCLVHRLRRNPRNLNPS